MSGNPVKAVTKPFEKIGKEVGRVTERVGKEVGRTAERAGKEVKRGAKTGSMMLGLTPPPMPELGEETAPSPVEEIVVGGQSGIGFDDDASFEVKQKRAAVGATGRYKGGAF